MHLKPLQITNPADVPGFLWANDFRALGSALHPFEPRILSVRDFAQIVFRRVRYNGGSPEERCNPLHVVQAQDFSFATTLTRMCLDAG